MTLDTQNALAVTFTEQLNTTFRVQHEPATTDLELIDVADYSDGHQIRFSLLFRGPHEPLLPQQTYPFAHNQLGAFDLFIVPIKRDADGLYYEAVFNRFVKPFLST